MALRVAYSIGIRFAKTWRSPDRRTKGLSFCRASARSAATCRISLAGDRNVAEAPGSKRCGSVSDQAGGRIVTMVRPSGVRNPKSSTVIGQRPLLCDDPDEPILAAAVPEDG